MFESRLGQEGFLSSKMSRFAPIQWVLGSFPRVKQLEGEDDKSVPSIGEVKNAWSYVSSPTVRLPDVDKDSYYYIFSPYYWRCMRL